MNEEKIKKAHEIASKITDELFSNCDAEEIGITISVVMEFIHKQFRSDVATAKERFTDVSDSYSTFLSNVKFEEIKDVQIEPRK